MECEAPKIHWEVQTGAGRYLKNIEIQGHTYIYLKNTWNGYDNFIHDPGCKCLSIQKKE